MMNVILTNQAERRKNTEYFIYQLISGSKNVTITSIHLIKFKLMKSFVLKFMFKIDLYVAIHLF